MYLPTGVCESETAIVEKLEQNSTCTTDSTVQSPHRMKQEETSEIINSSQEENNALSHKSPENSEICLCLLFSFIVSNEETAEVTTLPQTTPPCLHGSILGNLKCLQYSYVQLKKCVG